MGMLEVMEGITNRCGPPTWVSGTKQIDGAFATDEIRIERGCFLPFFVGVGDHRGIILDIPVSSLVGTQKSKVFKPEARRLNGSPKAKTAYIKNLEYFWTERKMLSKAKHEGDNTKFTV